MSLKKVKRWRNKNYLNWIKTQPCCLCGRESEPHHIKGTGNWSGAGLKADDILVMPVCHLHHQLIHDHPLQFPQEQMILKTIVDAVRDGVLVIK